MDPLVDVGRVKWSNQEGHTVGRIGSVRIVLAGPPRIPPGLPWLAGFPAHEAGPVACLYATPEDMEAEHCAVSIHLHGSDAAHGHGWEVGRRFAVVKGLGDGSGRVYHGMEAALEAALAILARQGAALA